MVAPIRPDEVTALRQANLPSAVLETFNEMIAQKWDGHSATICQEDVVAMLMERYNIQPIRIKEENLLDVEPIYRAAGWTVYFERPGYNEEGRAFFRFSKT